MSSKLIAHTKITGEIVLSIFNNNQKMGEIPLGTSKEHAPAKAREFLDAVKGADDIIDQIT